MYFPLHFDYASKIAVKGKCFTYKFGFSVTRTEVSNLGEGQDSRRKKVGKVGGSFRNRIYTFSRASAMAVPAQTDHGFPALLLAPRPLSPTGFPYLQN